MPGMYIYGYTDRESYGPDDTIGLHLATDMAGDGKEFSFAIERMGVVVEQVWPRQAEADGSGQPLPLGPGGRHVVTVTHRTFPDENSALSSGGDCGWPRTVRIIPNQKWRSGYYRVRFFDSHGGYCDTDDNRVEQPCEIWFVWRSSPDRHSNILLVLTSNTYQAYNTGWDKDDNQAGYVGPSLYVNTKGVVSRNRPLIGRPVSTQQSADHLLLTPDFGRAWPQFNGSFYSAEWPFVRWAEAPGDRWEGYREPYRIDYVVDSDLEELGLAYLSRYQLIVKVGHDEYWSDGMRQNLEAFVRSGKNAAMFTGNTIHFRVKHHQGPNGERTVTCLKAEAPCVKICDPVNASLQDCTTLWSSGCAPVSMKPEDFTLGVGMRFGGYFPIRQPSIENKRRPDSAAFAKESEDFVKSIGARFQGHFTAYRTAANAQMDPFSWVYGSVPLDPPESGARYPSFGRGTGVIGYECDGCDTDWNTDPPTPRNGPPKRLTLLASAPASWSPDGSVYAEKAGLLRTWTQRADGVLSFGLEPATALDTRLGSASMVLYEPVGTKGRIFAAGTTNWAIALSPYRLSSGSPAVRRLTHNILQELGKY